MFGSLQCPLSTPISSRRRLRSAVRPADRPPRAGGQRLLRDRAARHAGRSDAGPQAEGHHLLGRAGLGARGGGAVDRPVDLRRRRAGARHLLRLPAHRPAARRRGPPHRDGRVRPHRAQGHRLLVAVLQPAGRTGSVDEPRRLDRPGSPRLQDHGLVGRTGGGTGRRRTRHLRRAVPPRGDPHGPGHGDPQGLPLRRVRRPAHVDEGVDHRAGRGSHSGPGRRRRRDLRPVGRGRLGGGGGAGPQGGRRPAHLCLRRHRPAAGPGGGTGRGDVPAPVPRRPRAREGGRPLPLGAGRRDRPGAEAQGDRRDVHPRLRGIGQGARPQRK